MNRVDALAGHLAGDVARVVDIVGVIAKPAEHGVGTGTAEHHVIAAQPDEAVVEGVAGEHVVRAVAGARHRSPDELNVLEVRRKGEGEERGDDVVDAFAGGLGDLVTGIVDEIAVVAEPPAIVSVFAPPFRMSLPPSPNMMSRRLSPLRFSAVLSPVVVRTRSWMTPVMSLVPPVSCP